MTILEAIKAKMRPYPAPHTSIEVLCTDGGLDVAGEYSKDVRRRVNLVMIALLKQNLSLVSMSQSDTSLGFSVDGLRKRLVGLLEEEGLDTSNYVDSSVRRVW